MEVAVDENRMMGIMYAVVKQVTDQLTDIELAAINNSAQLNGDPRHVMGWDKASPLWDAKDAAGKPIMNSVTKQILAKIVLERLT